MKLKTALWVGLAGAFAATLAFFISENKKGSTHPKPPKGAPQLKIENPGSQHDFPKPPMESEVG